MRPDPTVILSPADAALKPMPGHYFHLLSSSSELGQALVNAGPGSFVVRELEVSRYRFYCLGGAARWAGRLLVEEPYLILDVEDRVRMGSARQGRATFTGMVYPSGQVDLPRWDPAAQVEVRLG